MRVLITFKSLKDCAHSGCYDKLRGFVYSLQKTSANNRHDTLGYKLFAFSNLFPVEDKGVKSGGRRHFIVSSPHKGLILDIQKQLLKMKEREEMVNIGEYQFSVLSAEILNPRIGRNCKLITGKVGTPPSASKKWFCYKEESTVQNII